MKVGIIGMPQTGKKMLFNLLTRDSAPAGGKSQPAQLTGVASVNDPRFDSLIQMYKPKKETKARINIELLPKIEETTIQEGAIFKNIADTNAICHVVRAFEDESVYHAKGNVNPERDIDLINSELILHDLLFIEKRIERIEAGKKKGRPDANVKEEPLLMRFKDHLEKELPLRTLEINQEDMKIILSYPFITLKEIIIALNVGENEIKKRSLISRLQGKYESLKISMMQISAKLESEIAALESDEERSEFMRDSGIDEPAINILSRTCMSSLGMMSFFTVGEDEVRQWMIKKGSTAPEAAGAIHSDIQRGFIRAEVIKYADLTGLGSEEAVKKAGKHLLMGKEYIVEDGDIINFRFNV
jgi:GTP-binding protein YchF